MLNEVFGEIFSARLWKRYRTFLPIGLLLAALLAIFLASLQWVTLSALSQSPGPAGGGAAVSAPSRQVGISSTNFLTNLLTWFLVLFPIFLIVSSYLNILLIRICQQFRQGRVNLREATQGSLRKWLSYLGAMGLLFGAPIGVTVIAAFFAGFFGVTAGPAMVLALIAGLIIGLVLGIYALIRVTFFPYAIVVDGERAIGSMRKSWRLTKGRWWSIFGTYILLNLVLLILKFILDFAIALPFRLSGGLGPMGPSPFAHLSSTQIWIEMGMAAVSGVTGAFLVTIPLVYGLLVAWEVLKGEYRPPPAVTPSAENRSA